LLKQKVTEKPMLELLDFNKVFQVDCDTSGNTIKVVLSQEARPIEYSSDKLNDARRRYSISDQDLYSIIQDLKRWTHYFFPKYFVFYTHHQAL
jgi:hypothetical protein